MGWSDIVGRVGLGASTGGISELFQEDGGVFGDIFGKGKTYSQTPLLSPEQQEALSGLLQFSRTGTYGGFTAGQSYGGDLGNFDLTEAEGIGQNRLISLLKSGTPSLLGSAGDEVKRLLTSDAYDPNNDATGEYKNFKSTVERNISEGSDRVKHNSSIMGNLYSTGTIKDLGRVEQEGQSQLTSKLAELYDKYATRKLSAIPLAANISSAQEGIDLGRIDASQQYGGLERMLKDTELQRKYADYLRQRQELQLPIQTMQSIYTNQPQWGFPSVDTAGGWNKMLDLAVSTGANILGRKMGGS
jgi:hypothetical protein